MEIHSKGRGRIPAMSAVLFYLDFQGNVAQSWPVEESPLVIGRGEFATACVADDALSRSHCMVVSEADGFYLIDLDSQNGTWVNGEPVKGRKLQFGDLIKAGKSLFYFADSRTGAAPNLVLTSVQAVFDGHVTHAFSE